MTSEFFKYYWFLNRTKIATYRRPRGAWVLNGDSKVEGASRESPQNLEFLFNVDEHFYQAASEWTYFSMKKV